MFLPFCDCWGAIFSNCLDLFNLVRLLSCWGFAIVSEVFLLYSTSGGLDTSLVFSSIIATSDSFSKIFKGCDS